MKPVRGTTAAFTAMVALLITVFSASVALGAVRLQPLESIRMLLAGSDSMEATIAGLRLARSCLAAAVGASLAVSGAVFQGLFRNPLADPYVIGSSGGAAFGAVLAIAFGAAATTTGASGSTGFVSIGLAAFAGGLSATLIVYMVAGATRLRSDASGLLLAGSALGSLFSALVSIVLALKDKDLHQAWF